MRTRAFGPTATPRMLPTPRRSPSRPSGLSRLLQNDEPTDFTGTPRAPLQQYDFTPISQLPGAAPVSTGEEGGEAPPGGVPSAPLVSPSQQGRMSLLQRLNRDDGPNEAEQDLGLAGKALGGAKTGLQGAKLLEQIFSDAGFSAEGIRAITNGGFFSTADLAALAGGAEEALAGDAAAVSGGQAGVLAQLGDFAPYLKGALAALQIGQIAASDLSDEQKAIGSGGAAAGLAASLAGAAASSAAGAGAGIGAGVAAPIAMGLSFIAQHFMEMSEDVPHEVREAKDAGRMQSNLTGFRDQLDAAWTPEALANALQYNASGYLGGQAPMAFSTTYREGGGANQFFGKPNNLYPTVSLDDLLAHPERVSITAQRGLSRPYLDPVDQSFTTMVRNRLSLLNRVRQGDPVALASLELGKARWGNRQRMERAQRAKDAAEWNERNRVAMVEGVGGDGGSSSGAF